MPELPEVESTVRYLKERVEGLSIERAVILWHRTIALNRGKSFSQQVAGATIAEVFRRGKLVGMRLAGASDQFLFTHLRMSGSLDVLPSSFDVAPHDRVIIFLSNGKSIRFNDTRKFGRMYLTPSPEEVVRSLAVEPLSAEFTPELLKRLLAGRKRAIKPALLDQSLIAGLGNIYVDESLWRSGIHPLSPCSSLPEDAWRSLRRSIQEILSEAVSLLGTDFGDGVVDGGMYRPSVYGRTGERCPRCSGEISRIVVGQRGTHLCLSCQPKPRKARHRVKLTRGAKAPSQKRRKR